MFFSRNQLPGKRIVLFGIGHTNAHVLRMWRMHPLEDAALVCVSNFRKSTYSGMLPGVLAGQYSPSRMTIDLVRLCAAAGAELIIADVEALDTTNRRLIFADRPPIPFDVLSVGVGSMPSFEGVDISGEVVVTIKPMQTLLRRLDQRLWQLATVPGPVRLAIVGGGAGGVEMAFCAPHRIRQQLPGREVVVTLVQAQPSILPGMLASTAARALRALEQRGVRVHLNSAVCAVDDHGLTLEKELQLPADVTLWATSATASPLLAQLQLPTDQRGFLLTRRTLQSTADAPIFAVGDAGTIEGLDTPKAGVYAVRQGPVLWTNIARLLRGQELAEYHPQRGFLKLLNTGDGSAIGEFQGISFQGPWAWRWKDWIDSRFVRKYQDYRPRPMSAATLARAERSGAKGPSGAKGQSEAARKGDDEASAGPRCAGCGGKIGASVLHRVLSRLEIPASDRVVVGLDQPDDAAVLTAPSSHRLVITTDFFTPPLDDAYLVGRIAALNALSDAWAMNAEPVGALAIAVLPPGPEPAQEELLFQMLSGGLDELKTVGATLLGGHTIEGPQSHIGFTIVADQKESALFLKSGLGSGDVLMLSKPLGTGLLLAAHMQAACRAEWMKAAVRTMLQSNRRAAQLARELRVVAVTDVTGFGLAGHLLEMLVASNASAQVDLATVPLLPGAVELCQAGFESTLAAANRAAEAAIRVDDAKRTLPAYQLLFDPQTNGGLLMGVSEDKLGDVQNTAARLGLTAPWIIGRVERLTNAAPELRCQ